MPPALGPGPPADVYEGTQADGPGDLQQNISFVLHQIRDQLRNEQPTTVSSVTIFFYSSLLSSMSCSISIAVRGYIQSTQAIVLTSMKNWISSAFLWSPVTGGLASNADFQNNMKRSEDANYAWTQLIKFGSVWMNNHRHEAQKNARKVCCHTSILIFSFSTSHLFISSCLHNIVSLPARISPLASLSWRVSLAEFKCARPPSLQGTP